MPQTFNVGSRSLLVTLVAWAFIVVGALACAAALVQHAEVASTLPQWRGAALPAPAALLVAYLPWVVGSVVLLSVALLACAVGLLLRMEWARRTAIGLLLLAALANLAGLWIQHEVVHALVDSTLSGSPLPATALGVFGGLATATQTLGLLLTLGACALLLWLVRLLMSADVRQEFA